MILELLAILAPVVICGVIGFVWAKLDFPYNVKEITPLIVNVGTPALVISTLLGVDLSLESFAQMFGFALAVHAGAALLGIIALKALGRSLSSYLPALMFPNTGNMGLPICYFAFGAEGLALAIAFFCVSSIGQFTVGTAIASGEMNMRRTATSTLVWGIAISLLMIGFDLKLPEFLMSTVDLIGGFTIPLMLIGLGVSVARLEVSGIGLSATLSIVRLLGGFLIGWGVTEIFALEGALRGVIIIQATLPVALFNYLFASYYNRDPEGVAGTVVVSTVLSVVTLPLLLWFAMQPV